ncbi:hypothetical protein [Vreelandella titanicae]|uniref:hypothetical protein n=1 Tax=Vreelandella titanicae TaxID=664683 RepID=UPI003D2D765B
MQDIFNFFNQGWVGSLIGLVGIMLGALGIFSYKISRSVAKPSYQKTSLLLIGREEDSLPEEVMVTYKGRPVERLTKTTLILWNNGTEVLDGKNIVETDPLIMAFLDGDSILSYKILKQTKDANKIHVEKNNENLSQLKIMFEYLNPNDGLILEILHDSEKRYPKITGSIKGVPKGFLDLGSVYEDKQAKIKGPLGIVLSKTRILFGVTVALGLGLMLFGLLPEGLRQVVVKFPSDAESVKSIAEQPLFFIVLGGVYAAMPIYFLWSRRKKYPKNLYVEEVES